MLHRLRPLLALLSVLAACDSPATPKPAPAEIRINPPGGQLRVGDELTLEASVLDSRGGVMTGRTVAWESTSPTVASVDAQGTVRGLSPGSTTIVAVSGALRAGVPVVVRARVAQLRITWRYPSLFAGDTTALVAVALDSAGAPVGGAPIRWSSEREAVATVSAGEIRGIIPGSAAVTAESDSVSHSVTVSVLPRPQGRNREIAVRTKATDEVLLVAADGTRRLLSPADEWASHMAWAPGGDRLAITYYRVYNSAGVHGRGATWIRDVEGPGDQPTPHAMQWPAWSPDGAWIAFSLYSAGQVDLYVSRPDGSDLRRLTNTPNTEATPEWSPDGRRIAFVRETPGRNELWTISPEGSDPERLPLPSTAINPRWSPDGKHLAYDSCDQVWVARSDGQSPRALGRGVAVTGSCGIYVMVQRGVRKPSWAPDGRWIAYGRNSDREGGAVDVVAVDGSSLRSIPARVSTQDHTDPEWSPDGGRIAFWALTEDYKDALWTVRPDGSDLKMLAPGIQGRDFRWRP